jgi:hypothetical protein
MMEVWRFQNRILLLLSDFVGFIAEMLNATSSGTTAWKRLSKMKHKLAFYLSLTKSRLNPELIADLSSHLAKIAEKYSFKSLDPKFSVTGPPFLVVTQPQANVVHYK